MKVCVFGAGAVGGHIAMRSSLGGAETSVVVRGRQLDAIRAQGLRVLTPDQDLHADVAASDNPGDLGPQDVVIVTVKAPALGSVAESIGPLLGPDTAVLFAMNGIPWWHFHEAGGDFDGNRLPTIDPGGALWEAVGPDRALGGVVFSACTLIKPGIVQLAGAKNRLVIGEPDGSESDRAAQIAAVLSAGGLSTEVTQSIRSTIWSKLMNNVASGLMAILTQCRVDRIAAEAPCEKAMRDMLDETAAVARGLGCDPKTDLDSVIAFMQQLSHKPSILQDLERGSLMEIEATYGIVLKLAGMVQVETPTLDLMVTLARLRADAAGLLGDVPHDAA